MGMLDDYGIDTNDIDAPSYEVEDGWYRFTVGDSYVKEGSTNNPDMSWLIIEYMIEDEDGAARGKTSDLFQLPADAEALTDAERQKLGWYVRRMIDLGFDRSEINGIERDDLIGLRGALQLKTTSGKGKNAGRDFQNIAKLSVDKNAPVTEAPAKAAVKRVPSKTATAPSNPFAKKSAE